MELAIIATDSREHYRDYGNPKPSFGPPGALLEGLAYLPDVKVHVLCCLQRRPAQSPPKLASNIWYWGLTVPKLGWLRTGYQGCIRAVRKKILEIRPQIVHGYGTERDCALCALFSGFPNLVSIQGNMAELARLAGNRFGSYGWLAARLENFTLKRTAGVICNSKYTETLVRPRARRTWCVPHVVREIFFATPPEFISPNRCTILNVGVICPRKRQVELLELAGTLHKQGLDFEWLFIGFANPADPYAATFLDRIKPAEQRGFARYLGLKNEHELIQCFDRASALVHFPSEEAFGLVVAEALARNLKLFSARLGGIVDIASGAPAAELFEMSDWTGLREAIARWIRSGFHKTTGVERLMEQRYHPRVLAGRHIEIYAEVLKAKS